MDYDGRVLSQADPGPGEKIVVGPIDVAALRAERDRRSGHHMLAHLRTEAYLAARQSMYPGGLTNAKRLTLEGNDQATALAKARFRGTSEE